MIKNLSWLYNSKIWQKLTEGYFKNIPGYEGLYKINRYGKVKSLSRMSFNGSGYYRSKDIILKPSLGSGYKKVVLRNKNKSKTCRVSSLVFKTFKPNVILKKGEVIAHMNNIKLDDSIYNLKVLTQRENCSKNNKGYSSQYVGVYWSNTFNKWIASIHIKKEDRYLGRFDNELKASELYQLAVLNVDKFESVKQFREYLKKQNDE